MAMLDEARRGSLTDDRDRSFKGRIKEIIPWKGDSLQEILRKIIFIVAVGVLIYSAYTTYIYFFGSDKMKDDQRELASLLVPGSPDSEEIPAPNEQPGTPDAPNSNTDTPSSGEQPGAQNPELPVENLEMLHDFDKLYEINPDIVGWISIDGIYLEDTDTLAINYPVVQTDDNDYYLERDFYGEKQDYGALFADYRASVSGAARSSNVTIYGHNMKTEYYFHHLRDYNRKSPDFISEHRLVNFWSLYSKDKYIIFACFLVSTHEEDDNQPLFMYHNVVDFRSDSDFDYWYKNVMYRNYYTTDIDCNIDDDYLTLSTCAYDISDSRFVVVARKLRPGEDPDSYTYGSNEDRHMPEKWYHAYGIKVPKDDGPDYDSYVPAQS